MDKEKDIKKAENIDNMIILGFNVVMVLLLPVELFSKMALSVAAFLDLSILGIFIITLFWLAPKAQIFLAQHKSV